MHSNTSPLDNGSFFVVIVQNSIINQADSAKNLIHDRSGFDSYFLLLFFPSVGHQKIKCVCQFALNYHNPGSLTPTPYGDYYNSSSVPASGGYICPLGHYCLKGGQAHLPCPRGTFADIHVNDTCKACTPGNRKLLPPSPI